MRVLQVWEQHGVSLAGVECSFCSQHWVDTWVKNSLLHRSNRFRVRVHNDDFWILFVTATWVAFFRSQGLPDGNPEAVHTVPLVQTEDPVLKAHGEAQG